MTWKLVSSRPWSISLVTTLREGYLPHTWWMPAGAAMRLRKSILDSSTPLLSRTWARAVRLRRGFQGEGRCMKC